MTQNTAIVDSHCHLDFPDFDGKLNETVAYAAEHGVRYMQTICTRVSEFEKIYAIAENRANIWCSVGQHPNNVAMDPLCTEEELLNYCARPKTIGIGETGLDYYYDSAPKDAQIASFHTHIAASQKTKLPVIVHTRDADDDTIDILRKENAKTPFPFLIHCFSTEQKLAEAALECGGYVSVAGIVTFKNAEPLRKALEVVPLERLLAETDSPYLAPVPHRGKRNTPAFTAHVVEKIAELKNVSFEEAARVTTDNFFRLFSKATRIE